MNLPNFLFAPLRPWHFALPGFLAYAVPLVSQLQSLWRSGMFFAASIAVLMSIFLVRHSCRNIPKKFEQGSGFFCFVLIEFATALLIWSGVGLDTGLAYSSFVLACVAAVWCLGAKDLFLLFRRVWFLALLLMPFVVSRLEFASLQAWNSILVPASHALDFCRVPNDISESAILLTAGRSIETGRFVGGTALNAIAICSALAFLRDRSFFFVIFSSLASLLFIPLFQLPGVILLGALVFYFDATSFSWFVPLWVAVLVFLLNIALHCFEVRRTKWIWQVDRNSRGEPESIFEGCDFSPFLFAVLVLLVLAGLGSSFLLLKSAPEAGFF